MNRALWIVQVLLALLFLFAGGAKFVVPVDQMTQGMPAWMSISFLHVVGACEVLGAIGLILPRALNIAPVLTPIAAVGCAIVMAGATVVHTRMKDYKGLGMPVILLIMAIIVAAGRF